MPSLVTLPCDAVDWKNEKLNNSSLINIKIHLIHKRSSPIIIKANVCHYADLLVQISVIMQYSVTKNKKNPEKKKQHKKQHKTKKQQQTNKQTNKNIVATKTV